MIINLPPRVRNLSGQRYGRLVCVGPVERRKNGHTVYACDCDCGGSSFVTCSNLKSGHTTSCGCAMREATSAANTTHGRSKESLYRVWSQMKQRCHLTTAKNYRWYGARGIQVCERWRNSFEAFVDDMGERPDGYWIDRIDSDGDYEPDNCRWANTHEQARNKRNNVWVKFEGRSVLLNDIERAIGSKDRVGKRLRRGADASDLIQEAMRDLK